MCKENAIATTDIDDITLQSGNDFDLVVVFLFLFAEGNYYYTQAADKIIVKQKQRILTTTANKRPKKKVYTTN